MRLRSTGLLGEDETGAHPDGGGTKSESGSERLAVEQTTGGDDLDGLAGHGALAALDELGNGGDEDGRGDIAGVTTTLTTLGADDIGTGIKGLVDMLGMTDHVHVEDASGVELLDDGLGGDTDGTDEELSTALNDDLDELIQFSLGVVVVGLPSATADLGKQEINTEGGVLVVQVALQFADLFTEHIRGIPNTTNNTETTRVGDSGSQLRASGDVHTGQQDGVVDLEQVGHRGADLL